MKILDYNNTAINLTYLLYLKVEINKENPKKKLHKNIFKWICNYEWHINSIWRFN